ncbi:alpha/beta hydrolase [Massilia niastensis]|uniref:alpha/beta hydrolase n=1 Tax=Massilia niastensis TaxID=544911 RepID=UPI0004763854|nr:alpha/beta fold hydrolase [Massilia niastensis]
MLKTLGVIMLTGIAVYAVTCLWLFFYQQSMIYFPPSSAMFPAPAGFTLDVPGAVIKVSERPAQGRRALIYLGGNAEDVTASLPLLDHAFPDHAIYLVHYRGYPGSTGKPSEPALVADALAVFDHVAARHGEIVVIGRSLGAGVAIQLASQRPVAKLVLITPFDSLQGLAAQHFPYFPVRWLLKDKYESWRHAPMVRAPTLLISAQHDEIIPARSTAQLLSRFGHGVATIKVIEGASHNSISDSASFIPSLQWARSP